MIKECWYDRGSGGFWLNYEAIPEEHRNSPGRIVRMVPEEELKALEDIDGRLCD